MLNPFPAETAAFALSIGQRQIWLHSHIAGDSRIYNEGYTVERRGALNEKALQQAMGYMIARHDAWRTTFHADGDEFVQRVGPPFECCIDAIDLRGLPVEEQSMRSADVQRAVTAARFDVESGPLVRAAVVQLADDHHRLFLALHHLIFDGATFARVFLPELIAAYDFCAVGAAPALPPAPQYREFVAWQIQTLAADVVERQLSYWCEHLPDVTARKLPGERMRIGPRTYEGSQCEWLIGAELLAILKRVARANRVSLYMVLAAAFATLLHRYDPLDEDIVIGTVASASRPPEMEGLLGYAANTIPLRVAVGDDPTFNALLRRVREEVISALSNSDAPLDSLMRAISKRRGERSHLFRAIFAFDAMPVLPAGWALDGNRPDTGAAKFDLQLAITEAPDRLHCRIVYDRDVLDGESVRRMSEHLMVLLGSLERHGDRPIARLPILPEHERSTLLVHFNATTDDYPRDATIHELFERQTARQPDVIAVACGHRRVSYAELNARAEALAVRLQLHGIGRGSLVGVCVPRSIEAVVAILAVLKAGAGYVALSSSDPEPRIRAMLEDSHVAAVITAPNALGRLPLATSSILVVSDDSIDAARPARRPPVRTSAEDPAYVAYTSGSTGAPKGVVVTHRGVVRLAASRNCFKLDASDVVLQFAPLEFDASTFEIWGALLNGGRVAIVPPSPSWLDDLERAIAHERVTTLWLTAPLFHQLVERRSSLGGVRQILAGGDVVSPEDVRALFTHWEGTLVNGYGPTENTTFTCCHAMTGAAGIADTVPIGRPISNTQVYVLDRRGELAPIGAAGELYTGGDGLARGYLNRPELTAERFVANPFCREPGSRLYRTGDRVRFRADGVLEFLGRVDRQVKIRGFRVEPGEIEAVLGGCGLVSESVVIPDAAERDKRLVAYVVPRNRSITAADVRAELVRQLPAHMIPATIVVTGEIPRTSSGKLDPRRLDGHPAIPQPVRAEDRPRTDAEHVLAAIWRDVLGVGSVGIQDNFFDLGGDSLRAVSMFTAIERRFGRKLPLSLLFAASTLEQLAAAIDVVLTDPFGTAAAAPRPRSVPM